MLKPGETFGEYQIVDLIGSGGQGDVFRVQDRLGLEWALKVSHEFTFDTPGTEARFHKEAQWVSQALRSLPRDCGVFVGEHYGIEARRFYAKMRLLTGESLAARLRRVGRFSLRETLTFGEQVARAVAAAHRCGALHRDLKPENVFIEADAKVQVLDWGCLQVIEAGRAGTTGSGPLCTPGYAGLEQYQGGRAQLKASTDVYSLGVILYEVIAGCHPFLGWARGPRSPEEPGEVAASVEAVLEQFPAPMNAPQTHAESPAARANTPADTRLNNTALPPARAAGERRWGVGDECVTMPAAVGRQVGYFDQVAALKLLTQQDTEPTGKQRDGLLRNEDLATSFSKLPSTEWPSQGVRGIGEPSIGQMAHELVVPERGVGGRPRHPAVLGVTQSVDVSDLQGDATELSHAVVSHAVSRPTASLSALQRAGRNIPEAWAGAARPPSTFEQAQRLAALWNVPSTRTAPDAEAGPEPRSTPGPRRFSTPEVIRLQLRVRPRPIEGIPDAVWALLEHMLAKHPEQRPQSMDEVVEALQTLRGELEQQGDVELRSVTVDQSQATWQHLKASLQRLDRADASAKRRQKIGRAVMLVCGGAAAVGVLVVTLNNPNQSVAGEPHSSALPAAVRTTASAASPSAASPSAASPSAASPSTVAPSAAASPVAPRLVTSAATVSAQQKQTRRAQKPERRAQKPERRAQKPERRAQKPERRATGSGLLVTPRVYTASPTAAADAVAAVAQPKASGAVWIPKGFTRLTPEQERVQVQYLPNAKRKAGQP